MPKKITITLCIFATLLVTYFVNLAFKDDVQEIKKIVYSSNQPTNIAHIEWLDDDQAIVFYEIENHENPHFGSSLFKKNLLGWEFVSGSTGTIAHAEKLNWGFSNLKPHFSGYTDLIRGKILDPAIEEVQILTNNGNQLTANLIEYNNEEKLWFLVTDGEDLVGSTITGLSSDGKIIEQITK